MNIKPERFDICNTEYEIYKPKYCGVRSERSEPVLVRETRPAASLMVSFLGGFLWLEC